MLQNKY